MRRLERGINSLDDCDVVSDVLAEDRESTDESREVVNHVRAPWGRTQVGRENSRQRGHLEWYFFAEHQRHEGVHNLPIANFYCGDFDQFGFGRLWVRGFNIQDHKVSEGFDMRCADFLRQRPGRAALGARDGSVWRQLPEFTAAREAFVEFQQLFDRMHREKIRPLIDERCSLSDIAELERTLSENRREDIGELVDLSHGASPEGRELAP